MSKVAVVGAGAVGTAIAYAAQIRGACRELALFDLNAGKVRAEVLDLNHGLQFTPMARITGSEGSSLRSSSASTSSTAPWSTIAWNRRSQRS